MIVHRGGTFFNFSLKVIDFYIVAAVFTSLLGKRGVAKATSISVGCKVVAGENSAVIRNEIFNSWRSPEDC